MFFFHSQNSTKLLSSISPLFQFSRMYQTPVYQLCVSGSEVLRSGEDAAGQSVSYPRLGASHLSASLTAISFLLA